MTSRSLNGLAPDYLRSKLTDRNDQGQTRDSPASHKLYEKQFQ